MSRENVEVVRRLYDAVAAHDSGAVLALYDPDVEWDFSRSPFASVFDREVYRGHEGIRALMRERYDAWSDMVDELDEIVDAGERVVCVVTTRGRGRASDVEVGRQHAAVWTLQHGRAVRVEWFASREDALKAAGASP